MHMFRINQSEMFKKNKTKQNKTKQNKTKTRNQNKTQKKSWQGSSVRELKVLQVT